MTDTASSVAPAPTPVEPVFSRRFVGKTALVTGSTRGLGRTMAEWLAKEGCAIVVSGREQADVDGSVSAMREIGVESHGFTADLSDISEAHRLAEQVLGSVERLDLLINNAGMSIRGNFWDVTDADWEYQTNVNYRSPFILAQHAAKHMIDTGIRGRIVNVSTIGAHLCHTNGCVYDAAKGAVETMTRNMAFELAGYGVTVNCVIPGAVIERPGTTPKPGLHARLQPLIPTGRGGFAEDIANAVRFFCLPESEWITGQSLLIDGGHATFLHEG